MTKNVPEYQKILYEMIKKQRLVLCSITRQQAKMLQGIIPKMKNVVQVSKRQEPNE